MKDYVMCQFCGREVPVRAIAANKQGKRMCCHCLALFMASVKQVDNRMVHPDTMAKRIKAPREFLGDLNALHRKTRERKQRINNGGQR